MRKFYFEPIINDQYCVSHCVIGKGVIIITKFHRKNQSVTGYANNTNVFNISNSPKF